jgi:hypothetical protein
MRKIIFYLFTPIFSVINFTSCNLYTVEKKIYPPQLASQVAKIGDKSPFLKVHMKDGGLYILKSWKIDEENKTIKGKGIYYSIDRSSTEEKDLFIIDLESVALLETNVLKRSSAVAAMTLVTGASVALTVYCLANPKACFGSCPTFYVWDGDSLRLQAEGFTSSIAPALEADDIDALYHAKSHDDELTLEVANEALETHVIRYADLLVVPRGKNSRVYVTPNGKFFESDRILSPTFAKASEGDILPLILNPDGKERFSLADEKYLGEREDIEIEFLVKPGKSYGLVIGRRLTLLSTFLFYQVLAYMGNDAGYWLAQIGNYKNQEKFDRFKKAVEKFNGIEILVHRNGKWKSVGIIDGEGPLATNFNIVLLDRVDNDTLKIKLRMTKGAIRLDYVALAEISKEVEPVVIKPYSVLYDKKESPEALSSLLDSEKVLVTFPGDVYKLKYRLPKIEKDKDFEFFLKARGYYLEWIRKEWLEEENPLLLAEVIFSPEQALRRLAPKFKSVEAEMEKQFWGSKYARP